MFRFGEIASGRKHWNNVRPNGPIQAGLGVTDKSEKEMRVSPCIGVEQREMEHPSVPLHEAIEDFVG